MDWDAASMVPFHSLASHSQQISRSLTLDKNSWKHISESTFPTSKHLPQFPFTLALFYLFCRFTFLLLATIYTVLQKSTFRFVFFMFSLFYLGYPYTYVLKCEQLKTNFHRFSFVVYALGGSGFEVVVWFRMISYLAGWRNENRFGFSADRWQN